MDSFLKPIPFEIPMKRTLKILIGYIIFIFVLMSVAIFFSPRVSSIYLSFAIFAMGIGAIVCQKKFHHGTFVDMGFRLNRNAAIGLSIGLLFTAIVLILHFWIPLRLGLIEVTLNEGSPAVVKDVPLMLTVSIIIVFGGAIMFIACLLGEELAFRGYILPKLEEIFGGVKAIILCSAIFGLWHLPAYFSIYSGGAAKQGWGSVGIMLLAHGISAVPICILYLTTRELYGVSLYHAFLGVFQYTIVASPAFGEASKDAIYSMKVLNEPVMEIIGWGWQVLAIFIMLGLCGLAKRMVVTRKNPANSDR